MSHIIVVPIKSGEKTWDHLLSFYQITIPGTNFTITTMNIINFVILLIFLLCLLVLKKLPDK